VPALEPGVFSDLFTKLAAQVAARATEALEAASTLVEERAIQSVSARNHPRLTPTTASPGGPPAMISGTLAKSISHSRPEIKMGTIEIKIGMEAGHYAPYYRATASSLYAQYLETGVAGRGGRAHYPFLRDAFEKTAHPAVLVTFKVAFSRPWL
jgi:hypothetical protein